MYSRGNYKSTSVTENKEEKLLGDEGGVSVPDGDMSGRICISICKGFGLFCTCKMYLIRELFQSSEGEPPAATTSCGSNIKRREKKE